MSEALADIVAASSVCEVFWTDGVGAPSAAGAILLWCDDAPALAFTFASAERAYALSRSTTMCVTLTEARSTGARFSPTAIDGRPQLTQDLDGDMFVERLLDQELRRYPPSRAYADSLLLQRENWWYLPRLIVRIDVDAVRPIVERTELDHHVVAVATTDGRLRPTVARLEPNSANTTAALTPLTGHAIPDGPAVAVRQDASFPDLEQWSTSTFRGRTRSGTLMLTEQPHKTGLVDVPTLWQRLTLQRRFARACRSGIKAAEHER